MIPSAIRLAPHHVRIVPGEVAFGIHRRQLTPHGAITWTPTVFQAVALDTTALMAWDQQGRGPGRVEDYDEEADPPKLSFKVPGRYRGSNAAGLINNCRAIAKKHKLRWLMPTPVSHETAWIWAARRDHDRGEGIWKQRGGGAVLCGIAWHDSGDLVFVQREPKLYIRGSLEEVIQCVPSEHFAEAVDVLTNPIDQEKRFMLKLSGVAL